MPSSLVIERGGGCLNGLALCSGYGGLELALERFFPGFKTVCHVEGEAFAVSHLVKKMEEGRIHQAPIWDDLRTFEGDRWCGKVDIISGGFPCQPFSNAGKQLGDKDDRHLWPYIKEIVCQVRPRYLFFENVPGVVKWILDELLLDIASMGYDASWCVVRAGDIGAPHSRARWFLWGESCDPLSHEFKENSRTKRSNRLNKERWSNLEGLRWKPALDGGNFAEECTHTECERWNEDKQLPPRRELDVEGLGEQISDTFGEGIQMPGNRFNESRSQRQDERLINSEDKWGGGFETWWQVEPSMGRLVDGATDWVDKLRILGNGVVPQQAHYALTILSGVLNERKV